MKKFLWGGLVGVFGYALSSTAMSLVIYVVENKLLFEPASLSEVIRFSLESQLPVWLILILCSGLLNWKFDLRTTIYTVLMGVVVCGFILGCYLGAVVF